MRRLLITGAAGFIAPHFVRYWLNRFPGDHVVLLDALTYAGRTENLELCDVLDQCRFVKGDIRDRDLLNRLYEQERFDTVVNFAAETHVDRSIVEPDAFVRTNVMGTFTLLEVLRKAWRVGQAECRFVQISTDEVYGALGPNGAPFDETAPYRPNNPYAASKAAADHMVRAYHQTYGLPTLITCCTNNFGPLQLSEKFIPKVIMHAIGQQSIPLYGDGKQIRDWLYVEDHCSAIVAVIEKGLPGEVYNIGNTNEWSNHDLAVSICDQLDVLRPNQHPYRDLLVHVPDRAGHDRRYAIDYNKIRNGTGWRPRARFEAALRETIQWYLAHMDWCKGPRNGHYLGGG